jgi:hypothetical protein
MPSALAVGVASVLAFNRDCRLLARIHVLGVVRSVRGYSSGDSVDELALRWDRICGGICVVLSGDLSMNFRMIIELAWLLTEAFLYLLVYGTPVEKQLPPDGAGATWIVHDPLCVDRIGVAVWDGHRWIPPTRFEKELRMPAAGESCSKEQFDAIVEQRERMRGI